jgi:Cu(I)/Ag(I) efflux system membrane protein CusA/SilA
MIRRLIDLCIANRAIVLILAVLSVAWGVVSVFRTPVDAIPDLSENQVIVFTEWPGRGPQVVEDQVTYPLSAQLQGLPHTKAVRATSAFGYSMIYVIFEDDVDLYWARSRVLEKLNYAQSQLPDGVTPTLGPDGTGVGHVFWYTVQNDGSAPPRDLAELRAIQDWYLRYPLTALDGVAEVASSGGFVREYQVDVDPVALQAHGVSLEQVVTAVRKANNEVGGKLLEIGDAEYFVRGQGYVTGTQDLERAVVAYDHAGTPILVDQVARVQLGGAIRRGVIDQNGEGEVVAGIIVMRHGANAQAVIDRVKEKLQELETGLPDGVKIQVAYDRTELIEAAIETLESALAEELLIVSLVILLFLFHVRSALVVVVTLPMAMLIAFVFMNALGVTSNIMSLGGMAIAIGAIVDASIVMVENAYRKLAENPGVTGAARREVIASAARQVGPAIFFSMLIIVTSFAPVFLLTGQEGKLFTPLAWTKTLTMLAAAGLAITLVPVLMTFLLRGKLRPESKNPVAYMFVLAYRPLLRLCLRRPWLTLGLNVVAMAVTVPLLVGLEWDLDGDGVAEELVAPIGSEFMPSLDEGSLMYMPVTLPGVTVNEAKRLLQVTDAIIAEHPEVSYVLGKLGRAETATDPAPVSMIETIILLKPRDQWREGITKSDILGELDARLQVPGLTNGWTQPIINRIQMLATGVRTDLAVKFYGPDLEVLGELSRRAEAILRTVDGAVDLYSERVTGGRFVDIDVDRDAVARYGLNVGDVHRVIEVAVGGAQVSQSVEGRRRFPIRVRYQRAFRDSPEALETILVNAPGGHQIPLGELARVSISDGPPMIHSEAGQLRGTVMLNVRGRDMGGFVREAMAQLESGLDVPDGYSYSWSGQWENQKRASERLMMLVPAAILIIFMLLYLVFRDGVEALLVLLSVPFALIGGIYLVWAMDVNFSVAVAVGFIALFGVAVETGVVMVVYLHEALDLRLERSEEDGAAVTRQDILLAAEEGSVLRLRPKLMTVATTLLGLTPLLWATGTGSDVMRPIAIPMVGGMMTSAIHVLFVTPVIFVLIKELARRRGTLASSSLAEHGSGAQAGRQS